MIASRRDALQLLPKVVVVLDLVRLNDGKVERERGALHWRCCQFHATAAGTVRLRDHELHPKAGRHQLLQRGYRKQRRAAEYEVNHGRSLSLRKALASSWPLALGL
jgi:hypothetical protein